MIPQVKYMPRGAARELFYSREPEILIEGPSGTGKTRGLLEKINLCLLKYPGARGLITRKTRASLTETVLVTLERDVILRNADAFPATDNTLRRVRQSYNYPNGSTLVVCGMDNPDRIMSGEFDIIGTFETTELAEDDWEKLLTRLRSNVMPYQQAIGDCNPGATSHWLNRRADAGSMKRLLSRHEDNPLLFDVKLSAWTGQGTAYIAMLDRLTGVRLLRLRRGKWATAEGVVYEGFDASIHLKHASEVEIQPEWRRIRSIDLGYTNPFVCQWWAIDGDGRMYLYRELYGTRRLVEDWAPKIKELSGDERYEVTISDHDAEDRATLEKHGVETQAAYKAVTPGLQAVSSRLRIEEDKKPRLFVLRDALVERDEELFNAKKPYCTEQEFECYIYPKGKDGKALKEDPVKENDHGMDAMRYAVAYVDDIANAAVEVRVLSTGRSQGKLQTNDLTDERLWTAL